MANDNSIIHRLDEWARIQAGGFPTDTAAHNFEDIYLDQKSDQAGVINPKAAKRDYYQPREEWPESVVITDEAVNAMRKYPNHNGELLHRVVWAEHNLAHIHMPRKGRARKAKVSRTAFYDLLKRAHSWLDVYLHQVECVEAAFIERVMCSDPSELRDRLTRRYIHLTNDLLSGHK